ncbi:hypothetical protein O181_029407 [Austropuccinia psidii MF-1]|uniref:Uncharacterized protein n=1 Tax=Austropuccinia psidii MF-1 TaxID=1389203 RepID=A0A9Q3CWI6_9BASI|nr:hypothetical protein [Austropuccinia psidii MF-1]
MPWPLEITGGHQPPPIRGFTSRSGKPLAQLNRPKSARTRSDAYMLLYTIMRILAQQFNGKCFMTPLCHLKSSTQDNYPFQRKASAPQSYNPSLLPGDNLRTPTAWLSRCWLCNSNNITPREYWPRILQGKFQGVVNHSKQFSGYQALQDSLDNYIYPYRKYLNNLCFIDPFGPIIIPLWKFKTHHSFLKLAISVLT